MRRLGISQLGLSAMHTKSTCKQGQVLHALGQADSLSELTADFSMFSHPIHLAANCHKIP